MPLSEKLRVEVFIPDSPHPSYKALLQTLQDEFTDSFGGCTVISNLEGQYYSPEHGTTILDRIHLLFVDTDLSPSLHKHALETYLQQIYQSTFEALQEEAILISVYTVSHVKPSHP
ncbi:MAG: hypothetical protein OEV08_15140 [Nitrospira sp.]|nr:hypothetical protein [Nitrospira sp.]